MLRLTDQRRKAEAFRAWHQGPAILVLANAWDVISARLFESEGFRAIGTTSAGIAATLGYPDGQRMSLEENLEVVARIAHHVAAPVSADLEAGYSDTVEGVVHAARLAIDAGAVGINLEDSASDEDHTMFDAAAQCDKIAAIRKMARSYGVPLVINARTDPFLAPPGSVVNRLEEAVRRGNAYRGAGADCVFVPDMGDLDRDAIAALVAGIDSPVNVIAGAQTPPLVELEQLGIARVSLGPRPMRAALGLVRRIGREIRSEGTYQAMTDQALTYQEVNQMLGANV
jgi:2-methylisocitrate lyase-like PEP mutase family enzyme